MFSPVKTILISSATGGLNAGRLQYLVFTFLHQVLCREKPYLFF
jgi:hypothetical protein